MTVHTAAALRRSHRRLDRRRHTERVIIEMQRRGLAPHLRYECGREIGCLARGALVPPEVAAIVTSHANVVSGGGVLVPNTVPRLSASHRGEYTR